MADTASVSTPSRAPSPDLVLTARPQAPYRFNWDAASRKKGPSSVYSETTDVRGDAIAPGVRTDLTANLSSLATASFPSEWSSTRHGFHAISTVLNNPHRKQAPPKAHSSIPPVPPAELPRIKRRDFDSYIRAVQPEWELFQASLKQEATPAVTSPAREDLFNGNGPSPVTARPWHTVNASISSISSIKMLPSLDTVPPIYFDESFNLGDPRTFHAVAELGPDLPGSHRDPASISHVLPLLEKLSHYSDIVEQHLVREISVRSSSFFAALSNLNDLQSESSECLNRISRLRDMLREVDERTAKRGLEIVRMEKKLRNLERVQDGVGTVKGVGDMVSAAHTLVGAGEWGEALDVIDGLNELLRAHPEPRPEPPRMQLTLPVPRSPLPPLPESPISPQPPPKSPGPSVAVSSLSAFSELPNHLRELSAQIATSLTFEMAAILKSDLEQRLESEVDNHVLRDRLRPVVQGLLRTHGITEALAKYAEVVTSEVNATVSQCLQTTEDADAEQTVRLLREMAHEQFMDIARHLISGLMRCLEAVQTQQTVIFVLFEVVQQLSARPRALQESLTAQLQELLSASAELANTKCGAIFAARYEQHAELSLAEFAKMHDTAWAFVERSEIVNRGMIIGLRGVLLRQNKAFLSKFHNDRIARSAKFVEDETWGQVEVLPAAQHTTDLLVRCAVTNPPEMLAVGAKSEANDAQPATPRTNGVTSPLSPAPGVLRGAKTLIVKDDDQVQQFFTVGATLSVLDLTADYLRVVINLGAVATDAMGKIIEFLRAFNSRTCQVVLGAGAMRSAGLKNITAKHLALASQSLAIMVALVPYIRETFRRHLSPKQAVMLIEFDKLKRSFQEHQNEIHEKLVTIMKDRLLVHCKSLLEVQWELTAPEPGPNAYMKLLCKETETLYNLLIMTQVLASIKDQLSEEFGSIDVQSQPAKDRMLVDVRFLQERLGGLPNVGSGIGTTVETVVQERPVPRRTLRERMALSTGPGMGSAAASPVAGPGEMMEMLSEANDEVTGL
ncbi:Vps54-domain-containing protein [Auriculariales sp. MPI-PUGE-AT-0066]|nr:Vps54-domain-containing protein [Auriculariales sp. MPI-PUGE-AT-0066]